MEKLLPLLLNLPKVFDSVGKIILLKDEMYCGVRDFPLLNTIEDKYQVTS